MPLAESAPPDDSTDLFQRIPADDPVPLVKRVTLLGLCSAATLVWLGFLATALIADAYLTPDPVPRTGIWIFVDIALVLIQGTMLAALKDWNDRRNDVVERRVRTAVQHETYLLSRGIEQNAEQITLLRGELRALMWRLPEQIRAFGDEREDEGEARAVKRLTAASGTDGPAGVASVSYLHTAPQRN